MPEEITLSRLFCLNKKGDEIGNVGNILPIKISSTFIKTIELALLKRLNKEINSKNILCNRQIGFIRTCGTELNLIKLRPMIYDLKKEDNKFIKYVLLIDLKNAYDKVIHKRHFNK